MLCGCRLPWLEVELVFPDGFRALVILGGSRLQGMQEQLVFPGDYRPPGLQVEMWEGWRTEHKGRLHGS